MFTTVVAIIGCLTGVISLGMNIRTQYRSRPRLQVEFPLPHLNGYRKNGFDRYTCDWAFYISVRLTNLGLHPISVKEVFIEYPGGRSKPLPKTLGSAINLPTSENTTLEYPLYPTEKPPFQLGPSEVREITYQFMFLDPLSNVESGIVELNISTSSSSKKYKVPFIKLTLENIQKNVAEQSNKLHHHK